MQEYYCAACCEDFSGNYKSICPFCSSASIMLGRSKAGAVEVAEPQPELPELTTEDLDTTYKPQTTGNMGGGYANIGTAGGFVVLVVHASDKQITRLELTPEESVALSIMLKKKSDFLIKERSTKRKN